MSSSAIRSLLSAGDLDGATALLSRPYTVSGRVQQGFRRGRTIGFPTANLRPRADLLLPNGVYAVRIEMGQQTRLAGVANVGVNPTFGHNARTVEAHIFDFSADIYGQRLRVGFVARLRGERNFPPCQTWSSKSERMPSGRVPSWAGEEISTIAWLGKHHSGRDR